MSATAEMVTVTTPLGPFTIVGQEVAIASGFTEDAERLLAWVHPRFRPQRLLRGSPGPAAAAVAAYFDGELGALGAVPIGLDGGPFLRAAWERLREVPPGRTISYRELALRAGSPAATRAAGQACARNPLTLFVPCHRVVAADGGVHHFGWGLEAKRWLLRHEGAA
jgi:methylated-DNA-[protein]-cysteine S-methyltransferase